MLNEMTAIDWIGVLGSLMIAGAYFAVSGGKIKAENPAFNLLNLVGAILILWSLWYRPNVGAITIELLWVIIASIALVRYWLRR